MIDLYCSSCLTLLIILSILAVIILTVLLLVVNWKRKNKIRLVFAIIISLIIGISSVAGYFIYLHESDYDIRYNINFDLTIQSNTTFNKLIFPVLTSENCMMSFMYNLSITGNGQYTIIDINEKDLNLSSKGLLINGTGLVQIYGEFNTDSFPYVGVSTEIFQVTKYPNDFCQFYVYSNNSIEIEFMSHIARYYDEDIDHRYSEDIFIDTSLTPGWTLLNATYNLHEEDV